MRATSMGENREEVCEAYASSTYASLTLDTARRHIYWIDANKDGKKKLCRFSFDANRREDLMELEGSLEGGGLVVVGF